MEPKSFFLDFYHLICLLCKLFLCLCRILSEQIFQTFVITLPRASGALFVDYTEITAFKPFKPKYAHIVDTTPSPKKEQIDSHALAAFAMICTLSVTIFDSIELNTLYGYVSPFANLYVVY